MIDATKIPQPVLHSLAYDLLRAVKRSECKKDDSKQDFEKEAT